jgi:hypothetical protein
MLRFLAVLMGLVLCASSASAITSEALLDTLQQTSFGFFWNEANPSNGLIKDRSTSSSPCSIASVGFGLSAICTGVDHGWITREQARQRVLTTLQTFWNGPQGSGSSGVIGYKGFFYHFLDMNTATRTWSCELSSIDSALLFAGILDTRQYFTQDDPSEIMIRALADSIYRRADWDWFRNGGFGVQMGWLPGSGFSTFGTWYGYNEGMIIYILALGSPTHPLVPDYCWQAWTSTYNWHTYYGYTYVVFPPLFGHQYSHCWVDFRNIQDAYMSSKGIDYFENSRRATLAQQAYCIANPGGFTGYAADCWGLTASDGPSGYNARGAPPAQNDDGTITPTAPAGSIAFAPEIVIPTLQHFYDAYAANLWGPYGFRDAFNLTQNWWGTDYIGIDEGPIVMMIENYRTGAIWDRFMQNEYVQLGLVRAGFTGVVAVPDEGTAPPAVPAVLLPNAPNPFHAGTEIRFWLAAPGPVLLTVTDVTGREVARLADGPMEAGNHARSFGGDRLASGVYFINLRHDGRTVSRPCVLIR